MLKEKEPAVGMRSSFPFFFLLATTPGPLYVFTTTDIGSY